jgi:hypothetical protein
VFAVVVDKWSDGTPEPSHSSAFKGGKVGVSPTLPFEMATAFDGFPAAGEIRTGAVIAQATDNRTKAMHWQETDS